MQKTKQPAVDNAPGKHLPRKGKLIGGTGCKKAKVKDCELCPLPDCVWTGGLYEEALGDIEALLNEIAEESK